MKSVSNIFTEFLTYLAMILTPVQVQLFAITVFVFGEWFTVSLMQSKDKTVKANPWTSYMVKAGAYLFIVMLFLVAEEAFPLFKQWKVASIISGFFAMRELKIVLEQFGKYIGVDLMEEINKIFKLLK